MDATELKEAIKQVLRDGLRIEVKTSYLNSIGLGNSQYVEVIVTFDGEKIASSEDIISIPDSD